MTEWELQQVRDTLAMATEKSLMPTISKMLIALYEERAALLDALNTARGIAPDVDCRALEAAIRKAES